MVISSLSPSFTILISLNLLVVVLCNTCDPLIKREGVRVKCHTSQNVRSSVDCQSSNRVPVGTVARYGCDEPFYTPTIEEVADNSKTLTCNSRGKWVGGLPKFHLLSCTLNCGVTNLGSFSSFVIGGTISKQTDWPWHATIFARERSDKPFKYICGGSLLKPYGSKGFVVVTAAHCVATNTLAPRNINDVQIVLGSEESTLEDVADHSPDAQLLKVKEIAIHKSYGGSRSDFQSDIALIRLAEPVKIKINILPICLSKSAGIPSIGEVGHIVGFGFWKQDTDASSIKLRRASFPVVNPDSCFEWRSRKLLPQEYCSGTKDYQNACNGDSGGGMVFNGTDDSGKKRFYLQGIVSHGRVNLNTDAHCDNFSVYTKVIPYIDWIYEWTEKLFEDDDEDVGGVVSSPIDFSPISRPSTSTTTIRTTTRRPITTTTTEFTTTPRRRLPSTIATTTTRYPQFPQSPDADVEIIGDKFPIPTTGKDYELEGVERHNYYRRMHGVPNVQLNEGLSRPAQANAEKQLREGTFHNINDGGFGENIFKFIGRQKTAKDAVRQAIDRWYNDVINYDWNRPGATTFSQVVWKSTTDIGVGVATGMKNGRIEQFVTVLYAPGGNVVGQHAENVFPRM